MINLYLSSPILPNDTIPVLAAASRIAVMAATDAERDALISVLAEKGIQALPLPAYERLDAYDAIVACGSAARALAGLAATDFYIDVDYTRTEEGDTRMQAIAQAANLPIYALGKDGALLTGVGEHQYFGTVSAYYPIMLLEEL